MPEAVEALQLDLDPGRPRAIGEAGRVVEEDLVGADLDERRRQAAKVSEEGRDPRVGAAQLAGVRAATLLEQGAA